MIDNTHSVLATLEPMETAGDPAAWFEPDLNAPDPSPRGRRILVVDDQESIRLCLRIMLESEGHRVTEASNGAEALRLFTVGEFDLVITDYQMPVMEGNELALGIKMLSPSQPILMITAYDCARAGADNPVDALLAKPFAVADLRCVLKRLLAARRRSAEPVATAPQAAPAVAFERDEQIVHLPA